MNILLTILLLAKVSFGSPVNYPISLAGNFGEPRPNHFHGGIDVKTGGVEGKPIFSIGNGYISHVSVGIDGFGKALYVHHPEGYTSVYCHLKSFAPVIKAMVKKWQYAHRTAVGDIWFKPTDLPVAQGQLIGVSGNTGASQAPHLHMELHDTRTGDLLDPLDFIGEHVKDALSPMAHCFMAYPKNGEGVFNGSSSKQSFAFSSHRLQRKFTAWGKVGFGIWANDYMEITYNRYGVKRTQLLVDGKLVFDSNVNRIPAFKSVQVNAWGDHEHFLRYNVWYMHSFVYPGMTLPFLKTETGKGYVNFNEERDYNLEYILSDFKGNTSRYAFVVTGSKIRIPEAKRPNLLRTVCWNRPNLYRLPGVQLLIRSGSVADNVELVPRIRPTVDGLSPSYSFSSLPMRLFHSARIAIRLQRKVKEPSKLYIVGKGFVNRYIVGTYAEGWVTGSVRDLHLSYEIAYDDAPPIISPIGQGGWNTNHVIRLGLSDAKSGVNRYEGYIDGQFVLFESVPRSPWVACNLRSTPVVRTGKLRNLLFTATDNCGNTRKFQTKILY